MKPMFKRKKIKEMTEKERRLLNKIIDTAEIVVFDKKKVEKDLVNTLTRLLEIINTLLYGTETDKRSRTRIRQ